MKHGKRDSLERFKCITVVESDDRRIVMCDGIEKEFEHLSDQRRGRIKRIMELWCGCHNLTREMFNSNEGRTSKNEMLKAFKVHQIRLYGFEINIDKKYTFIVVLFHLKKENKAEKRVLNKAKLKVDEFLELVEKEIK